MVNKTTVWIQVILAETILITSILALPASRNDYTKVAPYPYISNTDMDDDMIKQAVDKFLLNEENKRIRDILHQTVDQSEADFVLGSSIPDMTLFNNHIWTILNGYLNKRSRRRGDATRQRHNKRSVFDSIGHSGAFSGFGKHRVQKLEFTFENLLPYLIKEMKRNRRQVPKQFIQS